MLYSTWPTFAQTEAGRHFLELRRNRGVPGGQLKASLKKLAKPLKSVIMPLLRPLMDTRIPLPHRVYDMVFYHYVTPFSKFIERRDGLLPASSDLEQNPVLAKE